jgi:hypothetical protein
MAKRNVRKPVEELIEKIKQAIKGENAAGDIQNAVTAMLQSYGIQVPPTKNK